MKKIFKIIVLGLLIWLICFIIGFIAWPLHESQFMLFKSIMVVSSSIVGILFLSYYFNKIEAKYLNEGILIGIIWFAVNIIMDLIVLVGLLKTPIADYLISPGIAYLTIPIMSIGIGSILNKKIK